jgi:hypothetical protein
MGISLDEIASAFTIAQENLPVTNIVYTQGTTTLTAPAVLGKTTFQNQDASGVVVTTDSVDFIFRSTDLLGLQPKRGDTIVSVGETFTVIDPVYRRCDPYGIQTRVHTKKTTAQSDLLVYNSYGQLVSGDTGELIEG